MQDAAEAASERVSVVRTEELARTGFSVLRQSTIEYRRLDGHSQRLCRETYDHGNGVAILLYDPARDCVLLVTQFRYPAYTNSAGSRPAGLPLGWTIEVPAGMFDDHAAVGRTAAEAIRLEVEEETGIRIGTPRPVLDVFMSPGSVTERVALFAGTYSAADRIGGGGGLAEEGEDIAVMEPSLDEALAMVGRGDIVDAKTVILLYWAALNRTDLRGPPVG